MKKLTFLPSEKISIKKAQDLVPGISKTTAHRYIKLVKESLNKSENQIVTVIEFTTYLGIQTIN